MAASSGKVQRARRTFWVLTAVAVLACGSLSAALTSSPGPLTGIRVAASGVVLLAAVGLATRVMLALERARRGQSDDAQV